MNHFSYPITIVQIDIFDEPQNIFSEPKSQTPNYRANLPRIFNYIFIRIFNYIFNLLRFETHAVDSLNYFYWFLFEMDTDGHRPCCFDFLSSPYCFLSKADFKKRFS